MTKLELVSLFYVLGLLMGAAFIFVVRPGGKRYIADTVRANVRHLADQMEVLNPPVEFVGEIAEQLDESEKELVRNGVAHGWLNACRAMRSAVTPDIKVPKYLPNETARK